jgi:hypothetical protein
MRDQIHQEIFDDDKPERSEDPPAARKPRVGLQAGSWTGSALTRVGGRIGRPRLGGEITPADNDQTTPAGSSK